MALTPFSLDESLKILREEGFLVLDGSTAGELVSELERKGFPYLSPYGLHYCEQNVLKHRYIRPIIEALLGTCKLGHWLRYNSLPDRIECFRKGGERAGLRVLVVQQWAKGSQVDYYGGSHLHDLATERGKRNLHETSEEELDRVGCKPTEKIFRDGAL